MFGSMFILTAVLNLVLYCINIAECIVLNWCQGEETCRITFHTTSIAEWSSFYENGKARYGLHRVNKQRIRYEIWSGTTVIPVSYKRGLHGHSGDIDMLHGLHSCTIFFSLLTFQIAKSTVHTKTLQQKGGNISDKFKLTTLIIHVVK